MSLAAELSNLDFGTLAGAGGIIFAKAAAVVTGVGGALRVGVSVPQQQVFLVQRFGKHRKIMQGGINWKAPLIDKIVDKMDLREQAQDFNFQVMSSQTALYGITGQIFTKITDPYKAFYVLKNGEEQVLNIAESEIRVVLAKESYDHVNSNRDAVQKQITEQLNIDLEKVGYEVTRVTFKSIELSKILIDAADQKLAAQLRLDAAAKNGEAEGRQAGARTDQVVAAILRAKEAFERNGVSPDQATTAAIAANMQATMSAAGAGSVVIGSGFTGHDPMGFAEMAGAFRGTTSSPKPAEKNLGL